MIDFGAVNTRVAAFDEANGNDPIVIDEMLAFSNGALRDINPIGALIDPPADNYERMKLVKRYWEVRTQRAQEEFNHAKNHYVIHAKAGMDAAAAPAPIEDETSAVEKLTALQRDVKACQAALAKVRKSLTAAANTSTSVRNQREREARYAANRQSNSALLAAVEKIKI